MAQMGFGLPAYAWLGVLVASIAHFLLGGVWFAVLMKRLYPVALGIADRPPHNGGALFLVGPFLCSAVTIAATALLMRWLGVATYGEALTLGAVVGFGYLVPMTLNIAINPLFPRPFFYTLLNTPFFVAGSMLAAAILHAFS